MDKCVYCGKEVTEIKYKVKAITRKFPVCSIQCKTNTENYVFMDGKYKTLMYLLLFAVGIGILIVVLFFNTNMKLLCLLNAIAGVTFLTLPYPITSFETFNYCSIKTVKTITRIIGLFLILLSLYLISKL